MNRSIRLLAAALATSALVAVGADARADDTKKECAAAYESTQSAREQGKLIDARKQAVACSASACSPYVVKDCTQWLSELDGILPTVVFTATDPAGAETGAVRVTVDGQLLVEKLDGRAVPLDPGEHAIRYEMAGAAAVEQKVLIRQGEKNRLVAVSFKKAAAAGPATAAKPPSTAPSASGPEVAPVSFWNGYRIGALAAGVVGLAGVGVGAGFGAMTFSTWNDALTHCTSGDPNRCDGEGLALGKDATTSATVSTAGFVVGGVGLAAGVLLWILAPKSGPSAPSKTGVRVTPVIDQHHLGTMLEGSF